MRFSSGVRLRMGWSARSISTGAYSHHHYYHHRRTQFAARREVGHGCATSDAGARGGEGGRLQ
jgi:hypothetical protein